MSQEGNDETKVRQLFPPDTTVQEVIDLTTKLNEAEDIELLMVVAVSKDSSGQRFHVLHNRSTLFQKYALAGMVQSWATEHSAQSGGWDDPR